MTTAGKIIAEGVLVVPSFDDLVVPFRPILTISDVADEIIAAVRSAPGSHLRCSRGQTKEKVP